MLSVPAILISSLFGGAPAANNIALQGNGKILVAGQTLLDANFDFSSGTITRFSADGQLDTAFGEGGVSMLIPPGTNYGLSNSVRVTRSGSIAATVGAFYPDTTGFGASVHLSEGAGNGCN